MASGELAVCPALLGLDHGRAPVPYGLPFRTVHTGFKHPPALSRHITEKQLLTYNLASAFASSTTT